MKFAICIRDLLYGRKARPFGRILRHSWTRLLAHYTRSRALEYSEVVEVARLLALDIRPSGEFAEATPHADFRLRQVLSRRLVEATRRKAARLPPRDDERHRGAQRWYLIRAVFIQGAWEDGTLQCDHNGSCKCESDPPSWRCFTPSRGI